MNEYNIGEVAGAERYFGIYSTVDQVPTFGINPFDTREWVVSQIEYMVIRKHGIGTTSSIESHMLPLTAVIMSKILENGSVNIVDIGGGCGENYVSLVEVVGTEMEYHVVEQELNCELGMNLQLPGNIHFHKNNNTKGKCLNEEAAKLLEKADICLIIGTVQLFFPYSDLLKEIATSGVEYIYITRTMINKSVDTFYTREYIAPSSGKYKGIVLGDTPVAIINCQQLRECMSNLGYECCLDLFQMDYRENVKNWPKPYSEIEYRNLLFQAKKAR